MSMTTCPLCGYKFEVDQMACHASCALHTGCAIICCPNCGYQMVDERKSNVAQWLKKILRPAASAPKEHTLHDVT